MLPKHLKREAASAPDDDVAPLPEAEKTADIGPPPLQFKLKSLLVVLSLTAVVFALVGRLSFVWGAALVWLLLLIAAHMAANAMGTHATAMAPSRSRRAADQPAGTDDVDIRNVVAPTTQLGHRARLGVPLFVVIGCGSLVGSIVGTTLIVLHNDGRVGWSGIVLAAISSAGIGAFLTFLAGSCAKVTTRALREATHQAKQR